jgi:hypothetical protein
MPARLSGTEIVEVYGIPRAVIKIRTGPIQTVTVVCDPTRADLN